MDDLQMQLLVDLHRSNFRQGPGGEAETKQALMLTGLDKSRPLKIADIGCGTGASTIQLAKELDAEITAVDFLPEFLEELQARATEHGVADKITTLSCSMDALPFADEEFDVIWSEGAIYNMGFEAGVSAWRRFLKPGGKLIVSEITWLTADRSSELQSHWDAEYPEIDIASAKSASSNGMATFRKAIFICPRAAGSTITTGPCKTGLMPSSNEMVGAIRQGKLSNVKRLKLPSMKSTGTTTAMAFTSPKRSENDVCGGNKTWFVKHTTGYSIGNRTHVRSLFRENVEN